MKKTIFQNFLALALLLAVVLTSLPRVSADYSAYDGSMAGDGMGILAYGIDLSSWQGASVDFERIRAQGIDFVILRAGFSNTKDAVFERNYAAAKAAGLDVGAYIYSYAATTEDIRSEAESCKQWLDGKQFEYPIYFDLEDPEVHGTMSKEALTELALTFLDTLAADGWLVGLYSCRSWLEGKIDTQRIGQKYECWIAQYPANGDCHGYEQYHAVYGAWQYSASGSVDGVPGNTDMDVAFKDYPSICRAYGFNGYAAQGESITLCKASVPNVILRGEPFDVTGVIRSNDGPLLRVTLGIYDAAGKMVSGATAEPNADSFDLALIRQSADLTTLPEGEYLYRITAETAHTERALHSSTFAVSESGLWLQAAELPVDLKEGTGFPITGTVSCTEAMTRLRLEVVDESGTVSISAEAAPNGMTADLAALNLNLSKLKKGEYHYHVTAETAKGERTENSEHFFVWLRNDPIRLDGFQLQESYAPGALTGLSGTLASQNSEMQVELTLSDAEGREISAVTTNQPAKKVELSALGAALQLDTLPLGYYTLQILATNDAGPTLLYRDAFSVIRDEESLCGAKLPTTLGEGESFLLSGAIASDRSPLTYVSAALFDERGVAACSFDAQPNKTVFDLSELNVALRFSDLPVGRYRLCITAENDELRKTLLDAPVLVTSESPKIRWDGDRPMLDGLSFAEGMVPGCTGLLTADTPITQLRASVTDAEGAELIAATLESDDTTLALGPLNEQLRLAALPAGKYRLELSASCGETEELLLSAAFTVTTCTHTHLREGTYYPATCRTSAAVCATRCIACGGAVAVGTVGEKRPHRMQDGVCADCGYKEPKNFPVAPLTDGFSTDGRYVLAAQTEEGWYALGADAQTVFLGEQPTEVPSSLFWYIERQAEKSLVFCNYRNEALHLDAQRLVAATGRGHTGLHAVSLRDETLLTGDAGSLSFADSRFFTGTEAAQLKILALQWPE